MEIKIIKDDKWNYPCKGISKIDNRIVGFSRYGTGVVIDVGNSTCHRLYEFSEFWVMNDFEPIEEEKQPIDWDKVEYPIWAKDKNGDVLQIDKIEGERAWAFSFIDDNIIHDIGSVFTSLKKRNEWLNSLEILPKGTKIEITI